MNGKGRGNTLYAISLLLVGGCSSSLQHNEGATQVAHSPDKRAMSSIFLPSGRNSTTAIEKGEALSIKLIAAYLCDFREEKGNGDLLASGNKESSLCTGGDGSLFDNARSTQGEIAITASAGERGATSNGLSFNPADIKRNGRVVYYNEDIRESGQLINALNIPIYGPKTYDGGTFFVDLAILELDENENKQSRKLLQELAKVGSASYAPGTPVLNLLNSLGDALLSANGDDVELRYQMEFDPPYQGRTRKTDTQPRNGTSISSRAPLREGYYAFVRMEQRDRLPAFGQLTVSTGSHNPLLVEAKTMQLYRGGSWLLVRVAREDHKQASAQDVSTATAAFLEQLGRADVPPDTFAKVLEQSLKLMAAETAPAQ